MARVNPHLEDGTDSPQTVYQSSARKRHPLGTRGRIGNRVFYYASSTGAAISRGTLLRVAAGIAGHESVAIQTAAAAGATTAAITLTATDVVANEYEDGYFFVIDGTNTGQERRIVSHASATGTGTLTLALEEGLEAALTTSEEVTIRKNQYKSVVVTPGDALVNVAGAAQFAVGAGSSTEQFFWLQTWGPAMVQHDGTTLGEGSLLTYATSTTDDPGQVTLWSMASSSSNTTITPVLREVVAIALDTGDDSDLDHVWADLRITP